MRFLKGLALGLVGLLLLVSLPVLGAATTLNFTLLNPSFVKSEVKQIDLQAVVPAILKDSLPMDMQPYLKNLGRLIPDIKPWLDNQTDYLITQGYRYLKDQTAQLNLVIETESIKPIVVKWAADTYLSTLTPTQSQSTDLSQISQQVIQTLNAVWPSSIAINADTLGGETMLVIGQVKKVVEYWQTGFYLICVFTALCIVFVMIILRKMKDILRMLGIIFLIPGGLGILAYYLMLYSPKNILLAEVPDAVRIWIFKAFNDLINPWGIYSALLLIAGVVMLVASFYTHYPTDDVKPDVLKY
jgi:hypothetical protein